MSAPTRDSPPPALEVAPTATAPKMALVKPATARTPYDGKAHTVAQIAEIIRVSRATLYRHLERNAQPVATR